MTIYIQSIFNLLIEKVQNLKILPIKFAAYYIWIYKAKDFGIWFSFLFIRSAGIIWSHGFDLFGHPVLV